MTATPTVERIALQQEIVSICREFFGPYENVKEYVTEVESYLRTNNIPFLPYSVFGVYFDDPTQKKPGELRSFQGVVVEKPVAVATPYFIYRMKRGDYLYTKVGGNPAKSIPAAYGALFQYMTSNKIMAGATGGHQHVTMEHGQVTFEIYLEIAQP